MTGLERRRRSALHSQLSERLTALIGELDEGAALPTEAELTRRYGVSRTTVRRALAELAERGLVVSEQGRGSFVGPRRVERSLTDLGGFVDTFLDAGLDVRSELVGFAWSASSDGLEFRRSYRVAGEAWAVADGLVLEPYGSRLSRADLEGRASYDLLQQYGAVAASRISVSCARPPADVAAELALPDDGWALVLRRVLADARDVPVQHTTYHLRADRFEFSLTEVDRSQLADPAPPRLRVVADADGAQGPRVTHE